MLTDTPHTEMTGLKKPARLKFRHVPYDENDSVMKDIQERMKQKRKKKADLNRSRRLNLTNASLMLKLSLRANNRALAKALEDAHCEARQDKEMIFELQCALEAAQHELRQCHQMIQDLKLEGQSMIGMLTTLQESEECHRKRVAEVKTLLNEVTAKYLLNTVALIDKAADICNTPSLSKASSIFIRKSSSVSEGDSSRDTFSALITEAQGRSNIYYGNAKTGSKGEEVSLHVLSEPVPEKNDQTEKDDAVAIDEETVPTSEGKTESKLRRHSSSSRKRSRTAFFLDPKEMQDALTGDTRHHSQICEEELSCAGMDNIAPDEGDKCQQQAEEDDAENESDKISNATSIANTDQVENGNKDHCTLEKTDYREQDMELTQKEETELQDDPRQDDLQVQAKTEMDELHKKEEEEEEEVKENKIEKKTKVNGKKKNSKVKKNSTKQLKKLPFKKAIQKLGDKSNHGTSVFDLSNESFSKPVSPHRPQLEKKFEQNLSTESEKSEPGETPPSGVGNRSDGPTEVSVETREVEGEDENVNEKPLETEEKPRTCRRSRQSHSTLRHASSLTVEETQDESIGGTALSSPLGEEQSVNHRTLKPLTQVLNESSCKEGAENEDSNALLMKAKFKKKAIKPKQKKRLYDPKKSLDKEFTHTVINPSQDVSLQSTEDTKQRKSSRFNPRHRSGTLSKEERAKEIFNESLSGLLEESWMKDFLNDIDGEDDLKYTARNSVSRKKSLVKTRVTRKTFKMNSKVEHNEEGNRRSLIESTENGDVNDKALEMEDYRSKGKEEKTIRRGTVCLKKRSEGLLVDGNPELASGVSGDQDLDEMAEIGDMNKDDGRSHFEVGKGRMKNFASFVMMDAKSSDQVVQTGPKVVRRGTFDIKPQEEEEEGNVGAGVGDKKDKSERKSDKRDKSEGRQKKRKSVTVEKDEEEFDGETLGRKSRKRQKRDREAHTEWIEAEGEDSSEEDEMVVKAQERESKRSASGRPNQRRKTKDVEKEFKEVLDEPEIEEGIQESKDNLLETNDGYESEGEEKCLLLKQNKMGDGKKGAKLDTKESKISKVPRPKKKVIAVDDSSGDNESHDESISSVEPVSMKCDKPKKHQSGIPKRKEGSKSLQKIYGNAKKMEGSSVVNGSCLKMKNLQGEAKLDKGVDGRSDKVISTFVYQRRVTFSGEEKGKQTEDVNLGKKGEVSVNERTSGELKGEVREDKHSDKGREMADVKHLEEKSLMKEHQTEIDQEQRCDKEDVCEVNESGDASKSASEETGGIEEAVEEETGRRPSRQARAKAAKSLKEPSLSRKLRRGDPFTDNMLLTSPMVKNRKNKKQKKVSQNPKSRSALGDTTNVI